MSGENGAGPQDESRWLDSNGNIINLIYGLCAASAIFVLPDFFIEREHVFGFYAWFGFAACIGLVLAAKVLRLLLMRPEDYYD